MIKTTVDLDENLLERAVKIFNEKTKKEIISFALKELVERHEQKDLYDLFDSGESLIAENYDYKAMRGGNINDFD
ncbi:MAG: type II toxin-antitoxin system VapB family antitoxin [Oscillospiraceae bacterium]|jgi:hypothetical protein|nr:type II toxin-antitoxin system VapB family antitoxin [Oscillospiraceae bacterium]